MSARVVVVAGAGSLRAAPWACASLALQTPDYPLEIRLFDANWERLDLMDRLLRTCLEETRLGHTAKATVELAEALEDADGILLSLTEDCAHRLASDEEPEDKEDEAPPEPPTAVWELGAGDPNRPTPRSRLSERTRRMIRPVVAARPRSESLAAAAEMVMAKVPESAWILSLQRDLDLPGVERLDWPHPLEGADRDRRPHEILRWTLGDPGLSGFLEEARHSPLHAWLKTRLD